MQPVSADAGANQTVVAVGAPDLPEFELAVDFIGSGVAVASEETEVEVREGAAAEAAGLSCEAVYCAENPFCEGEYTDVPCPSLLNSSAYSNRYHLLLISATLAAIMLLTGK